MNRRALLTLGVIALTWVLIPPSRADIPKMQLDVSPKASEERLRKDIFYLAGEECQGRGVLTTGINKAADYIAAEFKAAGLKPPAGKEDYFQPFNMRGSNQRGEKNFLSISGPDNFSAEMKLDTDYAVLGMSPPGKVEKAGVVFVGYGIASKDDKLDEYAGLDTTGKVVVVLRGLPGKDLVNEQYGSLQAKLAQAKAHKAAAILFVNDSEKAGEKDPLMEFAYTAGGGSGPLPAFHIKRELADKMLKSVDLSLKQFEDAVKDKPTVISRELKGWTVDMTADITRASLKVKNVIGVLEGSGPLADETIIIGAHYDHLGFGEAGSLERDPKKRFTAHFGADDNGSGTTTVIELARRFGAMKERKGRRLVLMAFSGEESGLLGSRHYASTEPLYPLEKTVAMINLDMVGRLRDDKLSVLGTGTSPAFDPLLDKLNKDFDFKLSRTKGLSDGAGGSDHMSFYPKGIPVLFFFTGLHAEYHRPSDRPETINVQGMRKIADFVEKITLSLAEAEKPAYVKVQTGGGSAPRGPRLGITPGNYGEEDAGVLVEAVTDGLPAAKAGIKPKDLIIEIDGKAVKNLTGYMTALSTVKRDKEFEVVVLRDMKKVTLKVKLQ